MGAGSPAVRAAARVNRTSPGARVVRLQARIRPGGHGRGRVEAATVQGRPAGRTPQDGLDRVCDAQSDLDQCLGSKDEEQGRQCGRRERRAFA